MVEDTCGRYPPFNFNPQKASRNGLKGSQELDAQWPFLTMDTVYNTHSRHGPTYYWEVPISPDGPPVPQYGTIQEAWANITANYPGWNDRRPVRDFSNTSKARNMTADAGTDFWVVMMGLYTRDSYFCGRPWSYCWRSAIVDGLDHLYSAPGKAKDGPGPGECGRVSCSYNSAIWWCNDVSLRTFCVEGTT